MDVLLYPETNKITLSQDGRVRVGKYIIGTWEKDYVGGGFHFRPSPNEGRAYYYASLNDGSFVQSFHKSDLRNEIAGACKDGIAGER